ncbi:MAG: hypothetical protein ACOY0T_20790 [Myxococcota bacterium]
MIKHVFMEAQTTSDSWGKIQSAGFVTMTPLPTDPIAPGITDQTCF